jgi:hypothetical protein
VRRAGVHVGVNTARLGAYATDENEPDSRVNCYALTLGARVTRSVDNKERLGYPRYTYQNRRAEAGICLWLHAQSTASPIR